ncbi:MAG TPA: hypothetical protein VF676_09710 [Flavobacterium sp.]|jgi:hypothetical protein
MRTLKNQTLLYDADCPLCCVYTAGFVKAEMLGENGRKPFSEISADEQVFVDVRRAANEIALLDNDSKTVLYGVESLLKVVGNSFPWIEAVGNWKPLNVGLRKLYSFISYNRKVIIPSQPRLNLPLACVPDFNLKYRILFIMFAGLATALTLYNFSALLPVPKGSFGRDLLLAFGQVGFQCLFMIKSDNRTVLNYVGNLMTVSLMGALMLLPLLLISAFADIPTLVALAWFGLTAIVMFAEHFRRIRLLKLPARLCYTWILYRILALILILTL